ncbi:Rpn family recombination-promoting nuclease/putative transposase, partial [Pantoea sp. M_5]
MRLRNDAVRAGTQNSRKGDRTTPAQSPEEMAILFTANVSFFRAVITSQGHFSEPGLMKKKNSTPTPHDATFRQFLTQPD